jgi:hypothetical protein
MRKWIDITAAVLVGLPCISFAQTSEAPVTPQAQEQTPVSSNGQKPIEQPKKKATEAEKAAMVKKLDAKSKEMETLKQKAGDVTKAMAKSVAQGNVGTTQEGVQALRELIDQLDQIQDALQKIHEEIEGIKGWIEGQNEALPIMSSDILDLKRHKWGNYLQFQYRDTNQIGGASDAFSIRRARLGITQQIDSRTVLRVSFDVATGTTTNTPQMRDAYVRWDLEPSLEKVGTEVYMGQLPLMLGYELARSSGDREFPERAQYNRTLFAGERSRGVNVKHGLGEKSFVHVGAWNALTWDDLEQRTVAPGPGSRLAMSGGVRTYGTNWELGLSGFFGERPSVSTTRVVNSVTETIVHPAVDREIIYLDGTYVGLLDPKLFVRFEYMTGSDRIPIAPGANQNISAPRGAVDVTGHQVHLGYNLNKRNQINVRREEWDPNTDVDGNVVTTWAAAYSYFINPNARLTASHEWINDPSRASLNQIKYNITTLRVVFKF